MASSRKPKAAAAAEEKIDAVSVVIDDNDKEDRKLTIGEQAVAFKAPTANVLTAKAEAAVRGVKELVIDSAQALELADSELRRLKGTLKALEDMRESVSKPLHQAWEANNAVYREPKAVLDTAIRTLSAAIAGYHEREQARIEQERRDAEAKAEAERKRIADAAAETAAAAGEAAANGDEEEANRLLAQSDDLEIESQLVTAPVVAAAPTRIAGTSVQYRYGATLPESNADKLAALKYIIDNPQYLNLVKFDQAPANSLAVALKDNFAIPGFKLAKNPVVAQRGVKAADPFGL